MRIGTRPLVLAVLRRPSLWAEASRTALAVAPPGWWRRRPFLPFPDTAYLMWRTATAYGDAGASPPIGDVAAYLHWRRLQRRQ